MIKVAITPKTFWHLFSCVGLCVVVHVWRTTWNPFLPPRGSGGLNSGCWGWWQYPCPLSHLAGPVHIYKNHSLTKCPYTLEMYPLRLNSMLTIFRHHSSMWKEHNFKDTLLAYPSIMNWLLEWNCWSSRGSASRKDFRLVLNSLYQRAFQLTVLSTYILWSALYGIIASPQPI